MYTLADLLEEINWRCLDVEMIPGGIAVAGPDASITTEIVAAFKYYKPYIEALLELRWHWRSNINR